MKIKKVIVGMLEENCYILINKDECLIIDPGDEAEKIKSEVGNKKVLAILITHYHFDHIGALDEIASYYKAPVIDYKSEKIQNINSFSFEIIDTKGHKEDAVTFYFKGENVMFVGDFIFKECIGRCDLPGGNLEEMKESLLKIKEYDENIILYPGHGDSTSIKHELKHNFYL